MSLIDRAATAVARHSWAVVAVLVVTTAVFAAGISGVEQSATVGGLSTDSNVSQAYDDARADFTARGPNTTTALVAVENGTGNALSKASLVRTLRYQRALQRNRTLNATLAARRPTASVANVVARAAIAREEGAAGGGDRATNATAAPSLSAQIEQVSSMDGEAVAAVVRSVLGPSSEPSVRRQATRLLPRSYESGTATASSHLVVVTQETDGAAVDVALSPAVTDGQRAMRSLASDRAGPETYRVVAGGLLSSQQSRAIEDSLAYLGPLALAFVVVSLSIAYRDPVDVLLGLLGVVVVLLWTFGTIGWLGIPFNQTMIAVPILLIGLSVDYALHVVLRYREARADGDRGVRSAMAAALSGVGPALVVVTATTAVGFLANLTSPMADIRSFGVVAAAGIAATLAVFGLLVPALKTLIATRLARHGFDCTPSPPGTSGRLRRLLGASAAAARRAPLVVVFLAVALSAGAAAGATTVDVASPETAFVADDPPAWADRLPAAVQPGEFPLKSDREYVRSTFRTPDAQGYVLLSGNVTRPAALAGVAEAERTLADAEVTRTRPDGSPAVETPLSAMRSAAATNETFNATFAAADTDGDGVPERDIETLYDGVYATVPDLAARTIHRTDGASTYTGLGLRAAVDGTADRAAVAAPLRDSADAARVDGVEATATGQPLVSKALNDRVATTLIEGLALTLAVVLALLALRFRRREGSATLGALTLAPVACSVTWLLATMALLDIPIGLITALVGSISVGLGVDYAVHVSDRFAREYDGDTDAGAALLATVTGTGGALLSSAVTTAAGFGVLSLSLLPALRQFGFVLAVGIVYSLLASVVVQPSLLALWAQHGPDTADAGRAAALTDD